MFNRIIIIKQHFVQKTFYLLLLLSFQTIVLAQKSTNTYATCEGTINIFKSNVYQLQFLGLKGTSQNFSQFPALHDVKSANQIWFSYIAPTDGVINLDIESVAKKNNLKLFVFETLSGEVCRDIRDGNAEIIRMINPKTAETKVGLDEQVSNTFLYPVSIDAGKVLQFVIVTDSINTEFVNLNFQFKATENEFTEYEVKEVNQRYDRKYPSLKITIQDKDEKHPLTVNLIINGLQKKDGLYNASDLVFDVHKRTRIWITAEKEGYFPIEQKMYYISGEKDQEIIVEMERVKSGRSFQLSNIDFVPGTSEVTEQSIPRLKRLKDFLALNSTIHIEVQGHVYEPGGEQSFAGQKMSEARAKRIVKYLIDNGIAKERLSAVGFGNKFPIYKFAKSPSEEQANRRVEVLVK